MVLDNARFPEVFSLVGALLFFVLYGLDFAGVYNTTQYIPESVASSVPVDSVTIYASIAILALMGAAAFYYTTLQDQSTLPEETLT